MTTPVTNPPPPQPEALTPREAPLPPTPASSIKTGGAGLGTSGLLQRWTILVPVLIAATGALGVVGGFLLQDTARTTSDSTAPALIEVQDLFASVAEANAAATAAHLSVSASGDEDRASRNLYLDALRRANEQLTVVSADIGRVGDTDTSEVIRTDLQNIAASLTVYAGAVEAARVANINNLPGADDQLRAALSVVDAEIGPSVASLTEAARARYDNEAGRASTLVGLAIGLGFATLGAMVWIQYRLALRVRRVVNIFLALATLALIGFLAVLANGLLVRQQALNDASDGGYDAITASARMQEATFGLQSQLGFLLLEETRPQDPNEIVGQLIAEADDGVETIVRTADSDRELAAADALNVRWGRYRAVALDVSSMSGPSRSGDAVAVFQGEGLSSFNGVNTAIESVLSDNRTQFTDGVTLARSAVERLPWWNLALAVLAGVLSIIGFQQRLGDYR
ncbi:MAG: hypothetical protein OES24_12290 [Acidimicrobiia bacterium]|nr:hypothetical protein [Acidimicrobiia bacterium]